MACKLYLRMRMREVVIEKQIQWILSYIQGESVNIWKENILEDLETEILEYKTTRELLADLRIQKRRRRNGQSSRIEEKGGKIMEEFVQEFRRVARRSRYKGQPLVEEFNHSINRTIQKRLMESECQLETIKWWYE